MILAIKNITKEFKTFRQSKKALDNISINFKNNTITGLIGFNGSGKTTLYNIILNFLEKNTGEVLLNNKPITNEDLRLFTFLGSGDESKNATIVRKYLVMIADLYFVSKKDANELIDNLAAEIDFTENLNKPIKSLSKGNQQKIRVIASFLNPNAKYLILDEPFDGLDPLMVKKISQLYLNLKNVMIIITSHRMEVVQEMCDEFYVLKDGVIIDSKTIDKTSIFVGVNKEVKIKSIEKLEYVKSVKSFNKEWLVEIADIKFYKKLTSSLINDKKYIYSTIKEKNIAESVFLGYGDQHE